MNIKRLPKVLRELFESQLHDCPQNEKLLKTLQIHLKIENDLKKHLLKVTDPKLYISISNSLQANTKTIISIMNALVYIEQEEETDEDMINRYLGGN